MNLMPKHVAKVKISHLTSCVVGDVFLLLIAKTGHGPHPSTLVVICVVRLLFVLFYVLFVCKCVLPPGDNPTYIYMYMCVYICIYISIYIYLYIYIII